MSDRDCHREKVPILMSDKSGTDPKLPSIWVLLLVGIGLPAAAVSQLQERALAHPWLAIGLLACWCFLVGIGGFALKVWAT